MLVAAGKSILLSLSAVAVLGLLPVACKDKAPAKPERQGAVNTETNTALDANPTATRTNTSTNSSTATATGLDIEQDGSAALNFPEGQALSAKFRLKGDTGKEILVGLLQAPTGMKLSKSSSKVSANWESPTTGTHKLQFLLRDKARCVQEEGDETKCDIKATEPESVTYNAKYDVKGKKTFSLVVGGDTGSATGTGIGTGIGGGGNGAVIDQIIGLLGGASPELQGVLQGLSSGQLGQILDRLQNGGGGLDIGSIIGLVSGLPLHENAEGSPAQP